MWPEWAALLAGFPVEVPGQTINRLCGSGLQAVVSAAQAVRAGEGDVFIAGGVESMTRAPYVMLKSSTPWNRNPPQVADTTVGWRFTNPRMPQGLDHPLGRNGGASCQPLRASPARNRMPLPSRANAALKPRWPPESSRTNWFRWRCPMARAEPPCLRSTNTPALVSPRRRWPS